jgi:membrane protease YdiL (CAAX protease family)
MKRTSDTMVRSQIRAVEWLLGGMGLLVGGFVAISLFCMVVVQVTDAYVIAGLWVLAVIPVMVFVGYGQRKGYVVWRDIGLTTARVGWNIIGGIGAGVGAGFVGWILLDLVGISVGSVPVEGAWVFVLVSVIAAPIQEEVLFRGLLWACVDKALIVVLKHKRTLFVVRMKDIVVIVVISGAFLVVHSDRSIAVVVTKVLFDSVVFSVVYYKSKSLVAPIVAHAVANVVVLLRAGIG